MLPLKNALNSSIGRKFVMSISGIALLLFIIVHLLGNLPLYLKDGGATFNAYAAGLESFGPLLYVAELGLLAVFFVHIAYSIRVTLANKKARGQAYDAGLKTKGQPSNMNIASRNMIVTGIVLFVFLVIHIWQFRIQKIFYEETMLVDGKEVTNLYQLVVDVFANPINVIFYCGVLLFLGAHLRHGFWSALQSLGAMKPQWSKGIYALGALFALAMVVGFFGIPIYLFITHGGA